MGKNLKSDKFSRVIPSHSFFLSLHLPKINPAYPPESMFFHIEKRQSVTINCELHWLYCIFLHHFIE